MIPRFPVSRSLGRHPLQIQPLRHIFKYQGSYNLFLGLTYVPPSQSPTHRRDGPPSRSASTDILHGLHSVLPPGEASTGEPRPRWPRTGTLTEIASCARHAEELRLSTCKPPTVLVGDLAVWLPNLRRVRLTITARQVQGETLGGGCALFGM